MKIGAGDKKKVMAMVVLLAVAIFALYYAFGPSGHSSTAAAAQPATSKKGGEKKSGASEARESDLDPTLRTDILIATEKAPDNAGKRNIFRMEEPPPPKPIPAPVAPVVVNPTPAPPPRPPVNLKFYGFSSSPGEPKKAFLQEGEEIFVAKEGDIVNRRYKIVRITNSFVLVEDVLNNFQQQIPLTPPTTSG